jgi:hypothetical protein
VLPPDDSLYFVVSSVVSAASPTGAPWLRTLKERWRVSTKAQIKRLATLEIIPPERATDLYKLYSAKGWNREEPFDRDGGVRGHEISQTR